jgi:hypothetical protein
MLDPATLFLLFHRMTQLGIVPYDNPKMDMSRPLSQMAEEEARASRRKFRKQWRKIARARKALHKQEMGMKILHPGKGKKINRKYYVYYDALQKILSRKSEHSGETG